MERATGQDHHHHHQWYSRPSTMYVRADSRSFRDLVQRLTGLSDCSRRESSDSNVPLGEGSSEISRAGDDEGVRRTNYPKLHERRQFMRSNNLEIMKPSTSEFNLTWHVLLPTDPTLIPDYYYYYNSSSSNFEDQNKANCNGLNREEEEKAIKERGFYFDPSPRLKAGYEEPELLALFPLTSPAESRSNESC